MTYEFEKRLVSAIQVGEQGYHHVFDCLVKREDTLKDVINLIKAAHFDKLLNERQANTTIGFLQMLNRQKRMYEPNAVVERDIVTFVWKRDECEFQVRLYDYGRIRWRLVKSLVNALEHEDGTFVTEGFSSASANNYNPFFPNNVMDAVFS